MKTVRVLFAAVIIAMTASACADMTGPAHDDCPWMGGGGTCEQ